MLEQGTRRKKKGVKDDDDGEEEAEIRVNRRGNFFISTEETALAVAATRTPSG